MKKGLVLLPDMMQVRDWFDLNKPEIEYRVLTEPTPFNPGEVMVTAESNADEKMWVLMMEFCMALRKGKV